MVLGQPVVLLSGAFSHTVVSWWISVSVNFWDPESCSHCGSWWQIADVDIAHNRVMWCVIVRVLRWSSIIGSKKSQSVHATERVARIMGPPQTVSVNKSFPLGKICGQVPDSNFSMWKNRKKYVRIERVDLHVSHKWGNKLEAVFKPQLVRICTKQECS